jgi:hypothetical protein
MEELIKYIESNKDIIISDKTPNLLILKWEKNGAGFYLSIYKKDTGVYRCSGKIHIKDYCKDEIVETTIWRVVDSEKEMIKTLEELIDNLTGMQRCMIGKKIYGD